MLTAQKSRFVHLSVFTPNCDLLTQPKLFSCNGDSFTLHVIHLETKVSDTFSC